MPRIFMNIAFESLGTLFFMHCVEIVIFLSVSNYYVGLILQKAILSQPAAFTELRWKQGIK